MTALSQVAVAVSRLRGLPADTRRAEVAALLPDLTAIVEDEHVTADTRRSLAIRALRAVSPRTVPTDTPVGVLRQVEAALEAGRGPGRPPSERPLARPRTIRLPLNVDERLTERSAEIGVSASQLAGYLVEQAFAVNLDRDLPDRDTNG